MDVYANYIEEMVSKLKPFTHVGATPEKRFFCFGYNGYSEKMIDILMGSGITVAAILDNNPLKYGHSYLNVKVAAPSHIMTYNTADCIVFIASCFYSEMAAQLKAMGFAGEIIQAVSFGSRYENGLDVKTFNKKKVLATHGVELLGGIRNNYPDHLLIIQPINGGMGDIYWALAYFPAFCGKVKNKQCLAIVFGKSMKHAAELFLPDVIMLEQADIQALVSALLFTRDDNFLFTYPGIMDVDMAVMRYVINYLDFIDCIKGLMYGFGQHEKPSPPCRLQDYNGKIRLVHTKTVIISPYAKSVTKIPDNVWVTIADEYRKKGFMVCTNVSGGEDPINATIPLEIPINQVISAVEYAGHFIGIRSGLCDIIHTAKCKKTVVFRDNEYLSFTNKLISQFNALPGWEKIMIDTNDDSMVRSSMINLFKKHSIY